MKFIEWIVTVLVVFINLLLGSFVAAGLYGHTIAYSPEIKEKWLLVTLVWVIVLLIVDSTYCWFRLYSRRKSEFIVKQAYLSR